MYADVPEGALKRGGIDDFSSGKPWLRKGGLVHNECGNSGSIWHRFSTRTDHAELSAI